MSERLLEARGLAKAYQGVTRRIDVLEELDLDVSAGESVAIVGDSGVGKSTLLHLLGGLDRPDAGTLMFQGGDVFARDAVGLAEYRNRRVGFLFQLHHLLPEFTALENVEMPFRIGRRIGEIGDRARSILGRLGLSERLDHVPGALSGGEQQRVALARALVTEPALLLADEPTGNLDPSTGDRVFALLRELQRERAFSLVLATHSERLASGSDRVLRLDGGSLLALDPGQAHDYFNRTGV